MRRRSGFTLVELLVAMGLIVLILAVLAQAFSVGLETFGRLKAMGDMADRLRATAHILRRDLSAEHFEGSFRLSDANFGTPMQMLSEQRQPACGFFAIKQFSPSLNEGSSTAGPSYRSPAPGSHVLYFTVKLRGNKAEDYFTANVPATYPLLDVPDRTTNFNQFEDARHQNAANLRYSSQWAEVAYFLQALPIDENAKGTPLYSLHRVVRIIVPENRSLTNLVPGNQESAYWGFSYRPGTYLTFNNPFDVTDPNNRSLKKFIIDQDPALPTSPRFVGTESMLLNDVASFTVQSIRRPPIDPFGGLPRLGDPMSYAFADGNYESSIADYRGLLAIAVTIRVWDLRSSRTQQITIIQDL